VIETTKKLFSLFCTVFAIWKHLEAHCFRCFALFWHWKDKTAKTVSFQILPEQWTRFPGLNQLTCSWTALRANPGWVGSPPNPSTHVHARPPGLRGGIDRVRHRLHSGGRHDGHRIPAMVRGTRYPHSVMVRLTILTSSFAGV